MHHSIYTLGDLQVVRINLFYYKRLPSSKFGIYNRTKDSVVDEYRHMYAIIKSRALRGPIGKLP